MGARAEGAGTEGPSAASWGAAGTASPGVEGSARSARAARFLSTAGKTASCFVTGAEGPWAKAVAAEAGARGALLSAWATPCTGLGAASDGPPPVTTPSDKSFTV